MADDIDIITAYRYNAFKENEKEQNLMIITDLLQQKHMTKYRLARYSEVPYTTLNDICNGKTRLAKCSAETVYRLAKALNIPMEQLLESEMEKRCSFDLFKSNVCHKLKNMGDIDFLIDALEQDDIRLYYQKKWYPESLYLLAMVDYLSRENQIELCEEYNDLRTRKLPEVIYPAGILALCAVEKNDRAKEQARKDAIPEFMRFNIVESEVRNVS
ncbi:MAG: helix-turn-helix domain-containing protein [Lachnospiraceae bacterium]|nr:helix-turn-helix domain-containing protein [Lachnospiraceae bacterium]